MAVLPEAGGPSFTSAGELCQSNFDNLGAQPKQASCFAREWSHITWNRLGEKKTHSALEDPSEWDQNWKLQHET